MIQFKTCLWIVLLMLFFWPRLSYAFRSVSTGGSVPPAWVQDLDGKEVRLAFAQRLVVILFWRPNQPFSIDALRDLEQIGKEFAQRGIEILAIAEGGHPATSIGGTVKNLGLSFPSYVDAQRKTEEAYGVIVFPSTGIIGPDGRLKFYLPSRNSNYREIVAGKLKVELGLIQEREFEQRMKQIGEELAKDRLKAEEHLKMGLRLSRQGKAQEGFQELQQALALDPDLVDAHLALGYVHLDMGDPGRAQKEFALVLKHHPLSPSARVGMGISEIRFGNLDRGIEILKEAVEINPDPVQGYYELGRAYERKADFKQALHAYKWAVKKLLQGRR